jgi:DNA polymerase-3 subunit beta
MKFTINRKQFSEQVSLAARVAPTKTPKPILMNLKLTAQDGLVSLESNNMDIGMRLNVPCKDVESAGATLVPAHKFSEALRTLVCEDVLIETTRAVSCSLVGAGGVTLHTANVDEFPSLPTLKDASVWKVQLSPFCRALKRAGFAAGAEATRYVINAILLELDGSRLHLVSTDGRRLAETAIEVEATGTVKSALFPESALRFALGLDIAGDASIRVNDSWLQIVTEQAELHALQVTGLFPRWRDVIPKMDGEATRFSVSVPALQEAVSQVKLVMTPNNKGRCSPLKTARFPLHRRPNKGHRWPRSLSRARENVSTKLNPYYLSTF